MPAVLEISRGVDLLLSEILLGSLVFAVAIRRGKGTAPPAIGWLLSLTTLSSLLWMVLSASDMADSWSPGELWTAMSATTFGHLWCLRVLVLAGLAFGFRFLTRTRNGSWGILSAVLFLVLLSSLSGHAAAGGAVALKVSVDWVHAVATGTWLGGLGSLFFWLGVEGGDADPAALVVRRFSHFAMASTAAIAVTGLLLAYWAGVDFLHPTRSGRYGMLVLWKAGIFAGALALAAVNQFFHLRVSAKLPDAQFRQAIRREIGFEFLLVCAAILLAGILTRTDLPQPRASLSEPSPRFSAPCRFRNRRCSATS